MKNKNNTFDPNQPQTPNSQKSSVSDKVGDAVEGLGHKISDMGLPKVGQKIHDIGDKIETNHDDPTHPHDV